MKINTERKHDHELTGPIMERNRWKFISLPTQNSQSLTNQWTFNLLAPKLPSPLLQTKWALIHPMPCMPGMDSLKKGNMEWRG